MKTRLSTLLAVLAAALSGCVNTTPTIQTGSDAEVTFGGLTRVDGAAMDDAWARADIDLSEYDKVMFEGAEIKYKPVTGPYSGRAGATNIRRPNQTEFPLDDATKEKLQKEISGTFLEQLRMSDQYKVVDEAGPDILLVRGELIDVVSNIPPDRIGQSNVWVRSIGEATLVLELRDSQSGAIFARAVDRRDLERPGLQMMRSDPATARSEVRRLGRRWGQTLREELESLLN